VTDERWAFKLNNEKLDQLVKRAGLTEVAGPDGPYFAYLKSQLDGKECGWTRIFTGEGEVAKVVYHGLWVDQIGLDSNMIFAFTRPESPVPHWTFDSVQNKPVYAFHLDLIPRLDVGANLAYMDAVYGPITDNFDTGKSLEGLSEASLTPRQRSIMSQWMLAYRATEEAYPTIEPTVQAYLDHWFDMVENGLPQDVLDSIKGVDLAARDAANRGMIFNRQVDHVWDMVTPLIGQDVSELMRLNLEFNEVITELPA
jgi:hypothetical protein